MLGFPLDLAACRHYDRHTYMDEKSSSGYCDVSGRTGACGTAVGLAGLGPAVLAADG